MTRIALRIAVAAASLAGVLFITAYLAAHFVVEAPDVTSAILPSSPVAALRATTFAEIDGWQNDQAAQALATFNISCEKAAAGVLDKTQQAWTAACIAAATAKPGDDAAARKIVEAHFTPYCVELPASRAGFLTGYYEPEVDGSATRSEEFSVPLYRKPDDLIVLQQGDARRPKGFTLAGALQTQGDLKPYPTRQEIESGSLQGRGLELVWLRDKVTAFFIHVQGSARVRLQDGRVMRVGFAAKNGHPYTSIGRYLSETENIAPDQLTADKVRAWLAAHPDAVDRVLWQNKSFIFFREIAVSDPALGPEGALGVPLTPLRSMAVDRAFHTLGALIWIDTALPDADGQMVAFRHLMVAQDTGSAILGPARGDIFFGSGEAAGARAGLIRHDAQFIILLPKGAALPAWALEQTGPA